MTVKTLRAPALTTPAQALTPRDALLRWLASAQAAGTLFKAPVELRRSALGILGGELGFASDRPTVAIDDSALGMSLADRAASWCGRGETRCAIWVWARWRDGTLVVTHADAQLLDGERPAATHLHVAR
jgi:hypothetical protein